jgi:hypothetical protein
LNSPVGWWWPLLAGIAALIAVVAGPSREIAVPAATVAVVGAALTVFEALARQRGRARKPPEPTSAHPGGLREAFMGGDPGREDILLACDLLERKLSRPDLRARTAAEVAALVTLPPEEFRRYVAWRLDELEGAS